MSPICRFLVVSVFVGISFCGCTSTETHPSRVTPGDLLIGQKRLQSHLQTRREELARIEAKGRELDQKMLFELGRLSSALRQLEDAETAVKLSEGEKIRMQGELLALRQRNEALYSRVMDTEQETRNLQNQADISERNAAEDKKRIARLKSEIREFEVDVKVLSETNTESTELLSEQLKRRKSP